MISDAFLAGGGEMGERMRALDWSKTPLGPPARWPQALKTAVRIMLTSRQPFWLGWGPELTYLYNDPYKSIIGGKHPHALGRPFSEVWREIWDVVGPMADQVMTRDEGTYVEAQLLIMERHGYQEETYYTFSYSPIPNHEGGRGGLICANTDDTRRVLGERQLATLRELASRSGVARSPQDACTLGAQALATNPRDLPFAAIFVDDKLAAAAGIEPARAAALPHAGAGELAPVDPAWGPLPSGAWPRAPTQIARFPIASSAETGVHGVLVVGLSPFRKFDDNYRGFLGLVAGQLGAAMANAQAYEEERRRAEALAEIDRAKTAFFSNVSHEFRTPLTLMLGPIADSLADQEAPLPPVQRERQEMALRSALRLQKLVNTLLDFSRIEAGRVRASYVATELAGFTANLASTFRSAVEKAGLRLTVECPRLAEPAYIDREMWEKIVLNLLSNAFKFTFEGEIAVSLAQEKERFVLAVRDTGTGIPAAELPQVFERFHRVDGAKSRTHEGTGIGLALVQELVRLHGGSVAVESVEGAGSTFSVSIPRGSAHLPPARIGAEPTLASTALGAGSYVQEALGWLSAAEAPAAPAEAKGARVVWADDNADMREYVRGLLAARYEVEALADGEAALAAARRRRPDLVLADVMMPKLDGLGLARALRADENLRDVPVVLLSARVGEEARIEGLDAGADEYLQKPFSARELLARVHALLQSAEQRRRIETLATEARASRDELVEFVENATVAMHWAGPDGTILWANRAELEMLGYAPQEYIGRNLAEFHADPEAAADILARLSRDENLFNYEAQLRRKDGAIRHVLINSSVLWHEGKFVHTRCFTRDITERKKAEETLSRELAATQRLHEVSVQLVREEKAEALYEHILDAAAGIMRSEFASIQMFYPERGELRLLGFRGFNPQAAKFWEWVRPASESTCGMALRSRQRCIVADVEKCDFMAGSDDLATYLDTGIHAVQTTPLISRAGELIGMISTHWRAPHQPAEHELRLLDVLARQAADLIERSQAQQALRDADRRKDEFLAVLSHELRNPLAPIRNAVSLLQEADGEPGIRSQARAILDRQVTHLTRLVDDLLDITRISRGEINLKTQVVPLAEIVAAAVETSRPLIVAGAHQLEIHNAPHPVMVLADRVRLAQVISALLNNAAKYTPRGGRIELAVHAEAGTAAYAEAGTVAISVRDNGVGIDPGELPRLFEMFTQSEATRRRAPGGLGIGLALAKQLAERHGATLEGRSEGPGCGAEFTVRIPMLASDEPQARAEKASVPQQAARRILVVDDNNDAAESVAAHLRRHGHDVRTASDGRQALALAREFEPQVALVDIGLPGGMSGYELAHRLRGTPALLIALTGYGHKQDRALAEEAGFHHHFLKPADPRDIQAAIGAWRPS